jgi:hypothetical protein
MHATFGGSIIQTRRFYFYIQIHGHQTLTVMLWPARPFSISLPAFIMASAVKE